MPFRHFSCPNEPHAYIAPSGGDWNSHRNVLDFGLLDPGSSHSCLNYFETGGTGGGICGGSGGCFGCGNADVPSWLQLVVVLQVATRHRSNGEDLIGLE